MKVIIRVIIIFFVENILNLFECMIKYGVIKNIIVENILVNFLLINICVINFKINIISNYL